MKKSLLKKIIKKCGRPEIFCFGNIDGSSDESDIRRMKEYATCVRKVERLSKENKIKRLKQKYSKPIKINCDKKQRKKFAKK